MSTDMEIAHSVKLLPIVDIAEKAGIDWNYLIPYGSNKAKVELSLFDELASRPDGKLVLVSAMTPTPAGEGKTTVSIGLNMGLNRIGVQCGLALREPSMGPLFGVKGGATGGGWSQVLPMEDINMHFTGDLHAVSTAHNLLGSLIDNYLFRRHDQPLDSRRVSWPRVIDMNDRSLRDVIIGLGGRKHGRPRESSFQITASSEIMAILCLSMNYAELKERIGNILVGYTHKGEPVFVKDFGFQGAAAAVLKDALKPNLVQTIENTPAFVHGGPFANIAQGTNSIISTRMALKLFDMVVTEAGFGFDLGAEKFFDIVYRQAGFCASVVVLVVTVRALKLHGGKRLKSISEPDPESVEKGFPNLEKHLENINKFGRKAVVAINRFSSDTGEELSLIKQHVESLGYKAAVIDCWGQGGKGSTELAQLVKEECSHPMCGEFLYSLDLPTEKKIEVVAREIYGSKAITFTKKAKRDLKKIKKYGFDHLPVCIAKTQKSLSDNPVLLGRPKDFLVTVREIHLSSGAGFTVPVTGDVLLMPGLPLKPAALDIDISSDGEISGLF